MPDTAARWPARSVPLEEKTVYIPYMSDHGVAL